MAERSSLFQMTAARMESVYSVNANNSAGYMKYDCTENYLTFLAHIISRSEKYSSSGEDFTIWQKVMDVIRQNRCAERSKRSLTGLPDKQQAMIYWTNSYN